MSQRTDKSNVTRVVLVAALVVVLALFYALCGTEPTEAPVQTTVVESPPVAPPVVTPAPPPTTVVPLTVDPPKPVAIPFRTQAVIEPDAPEPAKIVQDDEAPRLEVGYPDRPVDNDSMLLMGSTEPGALVFHDEDLIPTTETGSFELRVALERGVNVVTIEAIDAAGNVTYRSQLVVANF